MKRKARQSDEVNSVNLSDSKGLEHIDQYTDKTVAVANYISNFVSGPNFKQNEIAQKLNKHESEISKWLNGFHNLTLKSILKLESVCSIQLLNPAIFYNYDHQNDFLSTTEITTQGRVVGMSGKKYSDIRETALISSDVTMTLSPCYNY